MSENEELVEAIRTGDRDAVRERLEKSPELIGTADGNGVPLALVALYHQHGELAEWLADRCAAFSVPEAAALGRIDALRAGLDTDPAAVDRPSPDGFPPLGLAAFFGRVEAIRLLLARGADPNRAATNPSGLRPLHSAAAHGNPEASLESCRHLLEAGAEPNVRQHGGWTPLHQAAAHGRASLVRLLGEAGADPDAQSEDGMRALDMARKGGHDEVVAILTR